MAQPYKADIELLTACESTGSNIIAKNLVCIYRCGAGLRLKIQNIGIEHDSHPQTNQHFKIKFV